MLAKPSVSVSCTSRAKDRAGQAAARLRDARPTT